jgi:hypothetical protein
MSGSIYTYKLTYVEMRGKSTQGLEMRTLLTRTLLAVNSLHGFTCNKRMTRSDQRTPRNR